MPLAGVGSRFIAILVDHLIWGAVLLVLGLVGAIVVPALHVFGKVTANWALGIIFLIVFLLQWGYFTLFEAFDKGRTPGKHVARIRVIHQSGRGISFVESLARNLVRIVDYAPGFYAIGVVAIFMTRRHQRLGDMVAGTLVVRDRETETPQWGGSTTLPLAAPSGAVQPSIAPGFPQAPPGVWGGPPHLRVVLPAPALAKLSVADLEVLESFFARRLEMDLTTRGALAERIASALCAKSGLSVPADTSVETFLEAVAHQFRELGRMS